jgi:nucleoid-associated protein YgaU
MESLRLTDLAQESYELGDYDGSARYAEEALRYAQLSDEYVALQLIIKETDDAIAVARSRIDWAAQTGADQTNPDEYGAAEQAYAEAVGYRAEEAWDNAIAAAGRVVDLLAYVDSAPPASGPPVAAAPVPPAEPPEAPAVATPAEPSEPEPPVAAAPILPAEPPEPEPPAVATPAEQPEPEPPVVATPAESPASLPAQYTIRPWAVSGDCFWNIAGRAWVYGDSHQWRRLYNANKAKLPDPDNPDLIEPGMVLDIPSIRDEAREGPWEENKTYPPLN